MTRTLGYARVSTRGQTLEAQLDALTAAGCDPIYREQISGAIADRPALSALLDDVQSGDTVVITKHDRLARSVVHLLHVVELLTERGVALRSLGDSWLDTSTPAGRFMLTIFGGLAELERHMIRERTSEGQARARAAGIHCGRPATYDDATRAAIRDLSQQGMTQVAIAEAIGVSRHTVQRVVRSDAA